MSTALTINNLSKRYDLGVTHANSIREAVNRLFQRPQQTVKDSKSFWALHDISFHVATGEVVGIIGKNGAGKSTLLKILSQITKPTSGRAVLNGRVASLLEVGTGFHPELTGRENIFLNGTILGMTKREVSARFDEIVAFSGIEKFIDTPVKRYSSGMTVRLGFAVAAHLDPEIMIVDEVLAVGDVEFQKRCLSKMKNVAQSGRTVLFVSHNLTSIRNLTNRCILLKQGQLIADGETHDVLDQYVQLNVEASDESADVVDRPRPFDNLSRDLTFTHLSIDESDKSKQINETLRFRIGYEARHAINEALIGLTIFRDDDFAVGSTFSEPLPDIRKGQSAEYRFEIESPGLAPGRYYCGISLVKAKTSSRELLDSLVSVLHFEVNQPDFGEQNWNTNWGVVCLNPLQITEPTVSFN